MKPRNPLVVLGRQRKANVIKDKRTEERERDLDIEIEDCCELCNYYITEKLFCRFHKKFRARNFICEEFDYDG